MIHRFAIKISKQSLRKKKQISIHYNIDKAIPGDRCLRNNTVHADNCQCSVYRRLAQEPAPEPGQLDTQATAATPVLLINTTLALS
jgi:hypothetical protein